MVQGIAASSFADRVASLLERVEFHRADSLEAKQAIFRMRHDAYAREGYIEPEPSGLFTDPDDESPNAWLIAVLIDGELASSIRLHIASRPDQHLPVSDGFPDILGPRLAAGQLIIDASRQTSRLDFTRAYPFLPYITMRSAFLAEEHFGADFITAACRVEYQSAFRRMYGAVNWAPPRPYPPLTRLQALMAYDCAALWRTTRERYPFVSSTPAERLALYARSSNASHDPYPEIAGARLAGKRRKAGSSGVMALPA